VSVPLTLLEREPSHGYDLKRDYDTYFGRGKALPYGQVYATLARLARDGKAVAGQAVAGQAEPGDGPDRKRYAITPARAAEVETWLIAPAEPGGDPRTPGKGGDLMSEPKGRGAAGTEERATSEGSASRRPTEHAPRSVRSDPAER
jgi:DNA-binding PadR family transcriptional regulator